jgi:dipeptidyl aminopeptidase/acylaminoacyl peptidase
VEQAWFAHPESIEFDTTGGRSAFGLFYPPTNPSVTAPEDERPPLIVLSHGGPTAAARPQLALGVQFWTSRGFAVVDVNYGGSTGYGRAFRKQLDGLWGIVDVEDCIAAAQHLVATDRVDAERLIIRGGSAGGFTTLAALTFHDVFAAGCSLYGIADLEVLATDTHKFESRYLDSLIGPWPERSDLYRERSPIHHTEGLSCPLIVLQGLEDAVVPPNQAELMVAALAERGLPHAYLAFEGEGHGFRQAATMKRALEAEGYFYSKVLGFELADPVEPVTIVNL